MTAPIVLGIDPLRDDSAAATLAAVLAGATGAPVLAVACHDRDPVTAGVTGGASVREARAAAEAVFADLASTLEFREFATRVVAGAPAATLHRVAEEANGALIVVGCSRRDTLGRVFPGSVTEATLHGSPCAVAVAPRRYEAAGGKPATIGVAYVDTSEGRAALTAAATLAGGWNANLFVITVIEPSARSTVIGRYDAASSEVSERLALRAAKRAVDGLTGIQAAPRVVAGEAAAALTAVTEELDLLVCGSRGQGRLMTGLMGGLSHRLVRDAACPVLVVALGDQGGLESLFSSVATATQA